MVLLSSFFKKRIFEFQTIESMKLLTFSIFSIVLFLRRKSVKNKHGYGTFRMFSLADKKIAFFSNGNNNGTPDTNLFVADRVD